MELAGLSQPCQGDSSSKLRIATISSSMAGVVPCLHTVHNWTRRAMMQ